MDADQFTKPRKAHAWWIDRVDRIAERAGAAPQPQRANDANIGPGRHVLRGVWSGHARGRRLGRVREPRRGRTALPKQANALVERHAATGGAAAWIGERAVRGLGHARTVRTRR